MGEIASPNQLRMSFLRWALLTVPLVLFLGTLSGQIAGSGYGNRWFDALIKPDLMPPGWAFGVAWTLLYILLGLAIAVVLNARGARGRGLAIGLFSVQLLLNYAWSPLFFAAHQATFALWLIVLIFVLAAGSAYLFWSIRRAAALLMLPYLGWLMFATLLAYEFDRLNPNAEGWTPRSTATEITL